MFADADEIITKILDKNSRNGQAILCKLLVNLEAKNIEELENHIDENVETDTQTTDGLCDRCNVDLNSVEVGNDATTSIREYWKNSESEKADYRVGCS